MVELNTIPTVLKDAWCRVRLDAIRSAAVSTISQLEELAQRERASAGVAVTDSALSASEAALRTCREELRAESGLSSSDTVPSLPKHSIDWSSSYDESLLRYRNVAVAALRKALG